MTDQHNSGGGGMPQWVRNLVMLVVLGFWAAFMGLSLFRGTPIDAIAWGVPGACYLALNPPRMLWPGSGQQGGEPPPEQPAPSTTGGGAP